MTFNYTKKYNKQSQNYAITSRYEAKKKTKLGTENSQEINIIIRKKKLQQNFEYQKYSRYEDAVLNYS